MWLYLCEYPLCLLLHEEIIIYITLYKYHHPLVFYTTFCCQCNSTVFLAFIIMNLAWLCLKREKKKCFAIVINILTFVVMIVQNSGALVPKLWLDFTHAFGKNTCYLYHLLCNHHVIFSSFFLWEWIRYAVIWTAVGNGFALVLFI